MKLAALILSAAVCASGQLLSQANSASGAGQRRRLQRARPPAELSTEYFVQQMRASVVSVAASSTPRSSHTGRTVTTGRTTATTTTTSAPRQPLLRPQAWALPLLGLSLTAMLLMGGFEVFVLLKARAAAPSRRHLFLGQALLLGLFLLAGLSAAASLTANPLSCAASRLLGLPAALVFAALLVKCVFLLSLNSGVYLPAPYQALVLLFAVLVQVAVLVQWLLVDPPRLTSMAPTAASSSCGIPAVQALAAALGYPGLLLLAVAGLAVRARQVHDNFREAWFIGLAAGLSLPTCLCAAIGSLLAPEAEREAWLGFGLLATAILVFLAMFLPKGRQLAALGREAPRDDRLSSLTLPDCANYSPSFFHFKPPPPPGASLPPPPLGMHPSRPDSAASLQRKPPHYHSQDRVALVSSALPGCTACRHAASPVYSDATSASNFDHLPYIHAPMETFVLPPGMYLRPEDTGNLYTTLSANPNVFFQRAHPGMMY